MNNEHKKTAFDVILWLLNSGDIVGVPIAFYLAITTFTSGPIKILAYIFSILWGIITVGRRTRIGKSILADIAGIWNRRSIPLIKGKLHPEIEPHELIAWLTKGRLNANISCHENYKNRIRIFRGKICEREFCRFRMNSKELPNLFSRILPRRGKKGRAIYLGQYEVVAREGKLCGPAKLQEWDATGITFLISPEEWNKVRQSQLIPYVFSAHIPMLVREPRIRVQRYRESQRNDRTIVVNAKFEDAFKPEKIKQDSKNWLSIPVCQAWEVQGKRPPYCEYIGYAPERLKRLQ